MLQLESQLPSKPVHGQEDANTQLQSGQEAKSSFNLGHSEQETEAKPLIHREDPVCILHLLQASHCHTLLHGIQRCKSPETPISGATCLKAPPRKAHLTFLSTVDGGSWYAESPQKLGQERFTALPPIPRRWKGGRHKCEHCCRLTSEAAPTRATQGWMGWRSSHMWIFEIVPKNSCAVTLLVQMGCLD